MKNIITGIVILVLVVVGVVVFRPRSINPEILSEVPVGFERNNPVPMVKQWTEGDTTYAYFSLGEKKTGGYSLELVEVTKRKIRIKAIQPNEDTLTTQALTYPYLLLALPKGQYGYEVVDTDGNSLPDTFKPSNPPLEMTLVLKKDGEYLERTVLRDPYLNNEGKTTAQIGIEALFEQEEMTDYRAEGINVLGTSYDEEHWYILLSSEYEKLSSQRRSLLEDLISQTVLELDVGGIWSVVITTDPTELPPSED